MTNCQASCEDRIAAHMEGRLADFRAFAAGCNVDEGKELAEDVENRRALEDMEIDTTSPDAYPVSEQVHERVAEYPLGVSVQTVVSVELSTGGPGDWLEVYLEREPHHFAIERIVYHFNDWFDHAERDLSGDDLAAAERFCELLGVTEPGVVVPA